MASGFDGSIFEKGFYKKEVTADEYGKSHAVILEWAANHAGAITAGITAAAFLIGFGWYCYLCGRAIAFNVPISEVPTPDTIYTVLLYIAVALVFLPTNIAIYRAMSEADDCKTQAIIVLKRCRGCYVFAFVFVMVVDLPNGLALVSSGASLAYVALYYICASFFLTVPILLFSSAVGVIQAISMRRVSKRPPKENGKALSNDAGNSEFGDADKPVSTVLSHFGRRVLAITVAVGVTAVLLVFLGLVYSRCLNGATVADVKEDPSQDYAVVFSSGDMLCVQRCCIEGDVVRVDVSSFEWVPKTEMEMRSLPNCSVQTVSAAPGTKSEI